MPRSQPTRDLVDSLSDAWHAQLKEADRGEFELVKRAARLGVLIEDRMAQALAPWGFTRADYGVLSTLWLAGPPYELRPSDLKARVLLTSGGVSNVLNRLEDAGHIERERDLADGRSCWVRLTEHGVDVARQVVLQWAAAQTEMFADIPEPVWRLASEVLRTVLIALGDREPPPARVRNSPRKTLPATGPDRA